VTSTELLASSGTTRTRPPNSLTGALGGSVRTAVAAGGVGRARPSQGVIGVFLDDLFEREVVRRREHSAVAAVAAAADGLFGFCWLADAGLRTVLGEKMLIRLAIFCALPK